MVTLAQAGPAAVGVAMRAGGLPLDLGAATLVVRSASADLARQIGVVYGAFPLEAAPAFADIRIEVAARRGWRAWLGPQVVLRCDGEQHFHPFPADTALPLMEWGTNWLIGQRLNHLLLFHAGSLERGGRGLLLPATPGSGKSTLTAALAHRGWRLLSDEFGVFDPQGGHLRAMLKPIALKNQSIEVVRRLVPEAVIGPPFPRTRKGTVAHVAAHRDAVARRAAPALPAMVVLPQWIEGHPTLVEPIGEEEMFRALAFNAFNYEVLGAAGFHAVVAIVRRCRGWRLRYGDLGEAVAVLDALWQDVAAVSSAQAPTATASMAAAAP